MLPEPKQNLLAARSLRQIRHNIDIINAPVARTKKTCRVVTPIRDQNDFRARPPYHASKDLEKPAIHNVGQIAGVGRLLTIEHAVNIEKNYSYPSHDSKSVVMDCKQKE